MRIAGIVIAVAIVIVLTGSVASVTAVGPGSSEKAKAGAIVVASLVTQSPAAKLAFCPKSRKTGSSCPSSGGTRFAGTPCPVGSGTVCSGVTPTCCYSSSSNTFYCASRCS